MRVAIVAQQSNPLVSPDSVTADPVSLHVRSLCDAVAGLGHEVSVYTRRAEEGSPRQARTPGGVPVKALEAGPARRLPEDRTLAFSAAFAAGLERHWAVAPPDVVHAHSWTSGVVALAAARQSGVPVVLTFHGLEGARDAGRLVAQRSSGDGPSTRSRLERALARDVSHVVAASSEEVFQLMRSGAHRRAVTVIPSGVDVTRFSADASPDPRLDGGGPHVLAVGRLGDDDGLRTAVAAIAKVPGVRLVLAVPVERDGGPDEQELGLLQENARRYGVADRVHVLGPLAAAELPALLQAATVVVTVPRAEPAQPIAVQAMACGAPLVASAVGSHLDTVVDGSTGVLVPPANADALASALRGLLGDGVRREALGIAAVDRARSSFPWERIAQSHVAVYRRVLGGAEESFDDEDAEVAG